MKNKKILLTITIVLLLILCIWKFYPSFQTQKNPISETGFYLNTVITITIYDSQDEDLLKSCMKLCQDYEKQFSRTIETSEIAQLNAGILTDKNGTATLSEDTATLLAKSLEYARLSQGAFDPSIGSVSSLWDFTAENPAVPEDYLIQEALNYVDYEQMTLNGQTLTFGIEHMQLDLGAIAKGYIADRIKDYLVSEGVASATINLGGNVLCIGSKPDGSPFHIGIQQPFGDRNELATAVSITDGSLVTSGIYERYFEQNGILYHHILNPETGYPYDNNLASVSILSKESVDGDGLSTSCFALGLEEGMELVESLEDTEALFITKDGEFHYSSGFPMS